MLTFLKRERAVRMLPWLALFNALLVLPLSGVLTDGIYQSVDDGLAAGYALVAMTTLQAVIILAAKDFPIRVRVREWERSLPVTMRRIVLERLASVWLTLFATFFAGSLVWLVGTPEGATLGDHAHFLWRGFLASGVCAALLGGYRPKRADLMVFEAVLVALVSAAAWIVAWFSPFVGFDVVHLAVLVGLLAFLWNVVPATSAAEDPSIKTGTAEPAGASGSVEPAGPWLRALGAQRWTIVRSTLLRPHVLLMMLATALYAWTGIGGFLMSWLFLAMVSFNAMRMGLNVLYGLDAFPIRRERVLRVAGLTCLGLVVLITALFQSPERHFPSHQLLAEGVEVDRCTEEVWGEDQLYRTHVKVPASEWRMTRSPSDATITAPWGETVAPTLHPVFPGAQTFIYNPYDVQLESSGEFLVWQVTRAVKSVHGESAGLRVAKTEWFRNIALDQPLAGQRIEDATSAHWGPSARQRSATPNGVGFAVLTAVLVWFLATGFPLLPNIPYTWTPAWLSRFPRGTTAKAALVIVGFGLVMMESKDHVLLTVLVEQAHMWVDGLLGSSTLFWGALILGVSAASYAFLAWRIQRIEIPPLAQNGWTKKPIPVY